MRCELRHRTLAQRSFPRGSCCLAGQNEDAGALALGAMAMLGSEDFMLRHFVV